MESPLSLLLQTKLTMGSSVSLMVWCLNFVVLPLIYYYIVLLTTGCGMRYCGKYSQVEGVL